MTKSRSLASVLLLALLVNIFPAQLNATVTRQSEQGRRAIKLKPTKPAPDSKRVATAKATGAKDASEAEASKAGAMRLVVQLGHGNFEFGFAAFSSDSRLVATGASGDVVVWDVATGREVRRFAGNVGAPGAQDIDGWLWGAFSPDKRLFAAAAGPNLRLWNIATGKLVWKRSNDANAIFDPEGDAPPVAFTPDGAQIIVRGTTDKLTWDAATGRLVARARFRKPKDGYLMHTPRTAFVAGKLSAQAEGGEVTLADKATRAPVRRIRFAEVEGGNKSDDGLLALALSPDDRMLLTINRVGEDAHSMRLWDAGTGDEMRELGGVRGKETAFHFKASGGIFGVTHEGRTVHAKEMSSGRQISWEIGGERDIEWLDTSPDGRFVVTAAGRTGEVWDAETGAQLARVEHEVKPKAGAGEDDEEEEGAKKSATKSAQDEKKSADDFSWDFAGFTPEETVTFYEDGLQGVTQDRIVLSMKDWKERRMPNGTQTMPYTIEPGVINRAYAMTHDTRAAAWETGGREGDDPEGSQWLTVWNADPKVKNARFQIDRDEAYGDSSYITLSPDGRKALVATSNAGGNLAHTSIKVWDADQKRALFKLATPGFRAYALAWSPDGRTLATGADDGTTVLWDASNGKLLRRLAGQRDPINSIEFSPDSRFLLSDCADGFTRIFDVATGAEMCRFITLGDGNWVVVAPDGRFDTSNLDEIKGVHWIAPDDPLKPLPLEIFMRDYYEPRLLARLLSGEKLPAARSLAQLNRSQPQVGITSVEQQRERPDLVNVTVEVSKPESDAAQPSPKESGVYDLRLFRDGQLVAYAPTEGGEVKTDAGSGRATITFKDIKLPRRAGAPDVELTAYAFNGDRVKSATARQVFKPAVRPQAAKGRAYVISVGVNAYANDAWDLRFAANDARRLQEVVAARIERAGEQEEIVRIPLVSDYQTKDGRKVEPRVVTEMTATKANFKAVLDALAGKQADAETLKKIPNAEKLRQATPEDLVIISFSSHGYADERGTFYLLASDTGAGREMRDTLSRAISSEELSMWLRDVDAGEMVLVVDACHSAASVQGEGFKPGPMGSRGLGQLSYDKGMRILTSTQADNVALESGLIEQGLLTYALTHDGIESGRADFRPRNREITVAEWLAYGVERVPALYAEVAQRLAEINAGRVSSGGRLGGDSQAKVVVFNARDVSAGAPDGSKGLTINVPVSGEATKTQQPALFDFARRRREALLAKTQ